MDEIQYKVFILDVDVSEDVQQIDSIVNQLDVPNLTEYAVSEAAFILMPNLYDYSPDKASNFFTDNGHVATGHRAEVRIEGGIRGETLVTLFSGVLVEISHHIQGQSYRIVCTDKSIDIRSDTIHNFGLNKNNLLENAQVEFTYRGRYYYADAVAPVSDGSASGTLDGVPLTEVTSFASEGALNARNFQLTQDRTGISTETEAQNPSPALNSSYKAPLRGVSIDRIVKTILLDYGFTPPDTDIPPMTAGHPHWSHIARPGYELESSVGRNNLAFGWNGYVTDMLHNPSTGELFFLYSHRADATRPQLLKYTPSTDRWASVYQASAHAEWWQMATADFETFFIMQSTGTYEAGAPRFGTYNPSEANQASPARTSILKLDTSDNTATVFANSGTRRPQMAVHYWYGFVQGTGKLLANQPRFGFLPETRTGFHVAENAVWYRYANSTQFGLARLRTSTGAGEAVITNTIDKFNNEASFDFVLDLPNREIFGSHTTIGASGNTLRSRHLVYKRTMPTSY